MPKAKQIRDDLTAIGASIPRAIKEALERCKEKYNINKSRMISEALAHYISFYLVERNGMGASLETWSSQEKITLEFDKSGLPIDLSRDEVSQLIAALEDLQAKACDIPADIPEGEGVYTEYSLREDDGE